MTRKAEVNELPSREDLEHWAEDWTPTFGEHPEGCPKWIGAMLVVERGCKGQEWPATYCGEEIIKDFGLEMKERYCDIYPETSASFLWKGEVMQLRCHGTQLSRYSLVKGTISDLEEEITEHDRTERSGK